MSMKDASPAHIAFMDDLKSALGKHVDLSAQEMLAVASQFVGNLIAMQDQTKMTPAQALAMVGANIEIGNAVAVAALLDQKGRA